MLVLVLVGSGDMYICILAQIYLQLCVVRYLYIMSLYKDCQKIKQPLDMYMMMMMAMAMMRRKRRQMRKKQNPLKKMKLQILMKI